MSALVTVVVPTVSRPKMLRETLASVLAQGWPSLEVILSDNGSDPETVRVVDALRDPRLRYRRNAATVPMAVHFNQCLAEARGDYFVVVSDDDLISPDFAEVLATAMERHPSAVMALPRAETMDERGTTTGSLPVPEWEECEGVQFVLDWLWRRTPAWSPSFISGFWRTASLRAAGGFAEFADGANAENAPLIVAATAGSVAFGREALFRYRVYATSYGMSLAPERLALSAAEFRRHLEGDPVARTALATLAPAPRGELLRGVRRMLARQYLGRLESLYLPRIGYWSTLAAARSYAADAEYLKALPRFLKRLTVSALRRDAGRPRS